MLSLENKLKFTRNLLFRNLTSPIIDFVDTIKPKARNNSFYNLPKINKRNFTKSVVAGITAVSLFGFIKGCNIPPPTGPISEPTPIEEPTETPTPSPTPTQTPINNAPEIEIPYLEYRENKLAEQNYEADVTIKDELPNSLEVWVSKFDNGIRANIEKEVLTSISPSKQILDSNVALYKLKIEIDAGAVGTKLLTLNAEDELGQVKEADIPIIINPNQSPIVQRFSYSIKEGSTPQEVDFSLYISDSEGDVLDVSIKDTDNITFKKLSPTKFQIALNDTNFNTGTNSAPLEFSVMDERGGETKGVVDLSVKPMLDIQGQIRDIFSKSSISALEVILLDSSNNIVASALTELEGKFNLENVVEESNDSYILKFKKDDYVEMEREVKAQDQINLVENLIPLSWWNTKFRTGYTYGEVFKETRTSYSKVVRWPDNNPPKFFIYTGTQGTNGEEIPTEKIDLVENLIKKYFSDFSGGKFLSPIIEQSSNLEDVPAESYGYGNLGFGIVPKEDYILFYFNNFSQGLKGSIGIWNNLKNENEIKKVDISLNTTADEFPILQELLTSMGAPYFPKAGSVYPDECILFEFQGSLPGPFIAPKEPPIFDLESQIAEYNLHPENKIIDSSSN